MPAEVVDEIVSSDDTLENPIISQTRDDDVVICGISCRLPESNNMAEFSDNLMNSVDMVTEDNRRWEPGYLGLPKRSGKVKDLAHFDAGLFGVSPKQANTMEPQLRLLLEVSYEAILDAGVNPQDIRGTRTGVFIGMSSAESFDAWSADAEKVQGYTMTGCQRGMFANRLSFYYDFKGPSFTVDTACSSSLLAMDHALEAINSGQCEAAIVGGTSLCLKPAIAAMFMKLGMLSPDGACKSFDASGNGYCRSEGIVAIFLQKALGAKRIYATLVHARNNCDGNKEQGITFPSGAVQKELIQRVYSEAGVNPVDIAYIEAHGTGTKAGDPQEVNSITDVFCKGRNGPLKMGSVKSNMGHPEPASGLAAVAKVIIAMETQTIPGNLHYKSPNEDIPGLSDGRLKVVDKNTPWQGGLVAVNSFGFGGTNVHALLKSNQKKKTSNHQAAQAARVCIYSGRTEAAVTNMLSQMQKNADNVELQSLLTPSANISQSVHPYRGFTVLNTEKNMQEVKKCLTVEERPVWFVFSGMGTQWHGMGRDMMQFTTFHKSILKSAEALRPEGIDLYDFLMNGDEAACEDTVNAFVGIAAIQVALVDLLRELNIRPDGITGHSVGELGCGYADGALTAEQTVLAAYWRGKCVQDAQLPPGAMAAVGMSWEEAKQRCPPGVVPACHNTKDTVTISGPKEAVSQFVSELKSEGVFAKEVHSAGNAFHSYYMASIAPALKEALDKVIPDKRPRNSRWISSSIPQENWNTDLARYSSADYYVNNLVSPVLFQEALFHVPENAVTIEIAPHALLQGVLKRSLSPNCHHIGLMKRGHSDNREIFLSALGKCFMAGMTIDPLRLYPAVEYPVPLGTPMISPWIELDHGQTWEVPSVDQFGAGNGAGCVFDIDISEEEYLLGHKIDGRVLFPATGYLELAWKALAKQRGANYQEMPVKFENIEIHRATLLQKAGTVKFEVNVMPSSGDFEICESGSVVVSGKVTAVEQNATERKHCVKPVADNDYVLTSEDIYKDIRLRGYEYGKTFQGILNSTMEGNNGHLRWDGNWVTFTDTMLQMSIVANRSPSLRLPTRIKAITINPLVHLQKVVNLEDVQAIPVHVSSNTDRCYAGGVEILGLHTTVAPRRQVNQTPTLEKFSFVPYDEYDLFKDDRNLHAYAQQCLALIHKSLKKVLETSNGIPNREYLKTVFESIVIDDLLPEIKCDSEEKKGLLKLLSNMFDITFDNDYQSTINDLMRTFPVEELEDDSLLNCLSLKPALKNCLDVVLENCRSPKINVLEVCGRNAIYPYVVRLLSSQPLVDVNYKVVDGGAANLSGKRMEAFGVEQTKWNFSADPPPNSIGQKMDLVVLSGSLHQQTSLKETLEKSTSILKDGGFLLVQEITKNTAIGQCLDGFSDVANNGQSNPDTLTDEKWRSVFKENGLEMIAVKSDHLLSTLFLCRLPGLKTDKEPTVIRIDSFSYEWVDDVRTHLTSSDDTTVWLVSNSNPCSGIVGMVNCLKQEPGGHKIRCVFNADGKEIIVDWVHLQSRNLVMNIYKSGEWGSFRHSPITKAATTIRTKHAYVNVMSRGDLSSLRWIESPLKFHQPAPNMELCTVHYAALNFRDIMLATGKLPPDAIPGNLSSQDCLLGLEVAGKLCDGRRVMGLLPAKGLATVVDVHEDFLWNIPKHWTMEEAASVPVVYATAYYALVVRGHIQKGMRVLIHSGSGGVGQAAISIALHYGCEVFTTVGSAEKREYLKKRFPQLEDRNFSNSRDTSFELDFLEATDGEGVDIVLNSLAGDKLEASVRLLAKHGHFLEIGKFDLSKNTSLGMSIFLKNITFHGILLDALFNEGNREWKVVRHLVNEGIENDVIQPLQTTRFGSDEIEQAFRFMAQGKHIGKVVLKIQQECAEDDGILHVDAIPQTLCHPRRSYIITGGLGGFGMELAQWLINRGAKNLILTSRSGIKTGFQALRIKQWQNSGVRIVVSTCNLKTQEGANKLMAEAELLGRVGGVFHLAMVLKDGLMENQTCENFAYVGESKVSGTINLDKATRLQCPSLDWFVVFSSVSCGRGNAGQANYGFANSVMERVCETRKRDGFPALAVQWGAIGDVGVVIQNMGDNDTVVGGTVPQRLVSCLQVLDQFLHQSQPVVSSFVLAEQSMSSKGQKDGQRCVADSIARILGVSDPSSISQDSTLADLGLDSLMGVEVKQVIDQDLDINLSMNEIRQLSLKKIREIQDLANTTGSTQLTDKILANVPLVLDGDEANQRYDLEQLMPVETMVLLNKGDSHLTPLFIIHPLEGGVKGLQYLASQLRCPVYGIQCTQEAPTASIEKLAAFYIQKICQVQQDSPYRLAGYSFGGTVAIEMCLQQQTTRPAMEPLILLDGSHTFVSHFTKEYCKVGNFEAGDQAAETEVLLAFTRQFTTVDAAFLEKITSSNDLEAKLSLTIAELEKKTGFENANDLKVAAQSFIDKLYAGHRYQPKSSYHGSVTLIRVKDSAVASSDYDLKQVCDGGITVHSVDGNHKSFIQEPLGKTVADLVNDVLTKTA